MDISRTITVILYYDEYEREMGDGYYPVTSIKCETESHFKITHETFFLSNSGAWEQKNTSVKEAILIPGWNSYVAINGLDCDEGIKLLKILNEKSKKLQLQMGVVEVLQGNMICNSNNRMLYPKNQRFI